MSNQENEFGVFLMGFFIGGLIGAGVGLLFAPQSGGETREQIHRKSVELSEQATQRADEARAKAEQLLSEARVKMDEATRHLQERAKELQDQTKTLVEETQSQIKAKLPHKDAVTAPVEPAAPAEPVAA